MFLVPIQTEGQKSKQQISAFGFTESSSSEKNMRFF